MKKEFFSKRVLLFLLPVFLAFSNTNAQIKWNFGSTTSDSTRLPVSSTIPANVTVSAVTVGNYYTGATKPFFLDNSQPSTTAPSYSGASGNYALATTAVTGVSLANLYSATYVEFTLTPAVGYQVNLTAIQFGCRSTAQNSGLNGGPGSYHIRTSIDNYGNNDLTNNASSLANGNFVTPTDSKWYWISPSFNNGITNVTAGLNGAVTVRIYASQVTNTANSVGANWRIDDLTVTATATIPAAGNYYYKGSGSITSLANWGSNTDGSGSAPSSFNVHNNTYNLANTSGTVNLDANWYIGGTLNIASGITLNTDPYKLTIGSNAGGAGSIAAGSGNYITGSVTVQQYITAQRGYRALGHPFTTDQPLTQLSNAFTITTNPSSAFNYNPTAAPGSALQGITDINANNWQLNKGILALVRGKGNQGINFDYTNCSNCSGGLPSAFILGVNGTVNSGTLADVPLSYNAGANNYNLIGNPFPSPINIKLLKSNGSVALSSNSNISATIYVYNPNKGGASSTSIAAGGYDSYTNDGNTDIIIPMLGAFFVQPSAASQVLKFDETIKSTSTALALFGGQKNTHLLQLEIATATGKWDDLTIRMEENSTAQANDRYDGIKMNNNALDFYSISSDKKKLCIDSRNNALTTQVIPLGIYTNLEDDFTIRLNSPALEDMEVFLRDKLFNILTPLKQTGDNYTFSITKDSVTKGDDRFELLLKPASKALTLNESADGSVNIKIYPNPASEKILVNYPAEKNGGMLTVSLTDINGNVLFKKEIIATSPGSISIPLQNMSAGVYFVRTLGANGGKTEKVIVK